MKKNIAENNLKEYLNRQESLTLDEIFALFQRIEPDISRNAVKLRIFRLIQKGTIQRSGHGAITIAGKSEFKPQLDKEQKRIALHIRKRFPYADYCCWRFSSIREFHQHISVVDFLIVEVERGALGTIYNFLMESREDVFKKPNKEIIEDIIIGKKNPIIVKALIMESPIIRVNKIPVPALEKILVDLYSDKELFYFLQGNELLHIFRNALDKYVVNIDKMLRYARRRGKEEELRGMLQQIEKSN